MILLKNNFLNHTVNIIDWIDNYALDFFKTKNEMTKEEIIDNISSIITFNPKLETFDFAVYSNSNLNDIDENCIDYEENILIAKCLCDILNGSVHYQKAIDEVKKIINQYSNNENFTSFVYYTIGNAIVTYDYDGEDIISVSIPIKYHIDIVLNGEKVWSWDDYKKQNSKNIENEQ